MNFNIPQQNRLEIIAEKANNINNFLDDDQVQEGIKMLEVAQNKDEAISAISYITNCIAYRGEGGDYDTYTRASLRMIDKLEIEFLAYSSYDSACKYKVDSAMKYFTL